MARIVHFSASAPSELKPQSHSVWLCQCGLSQNRPFCDGSHAIAQQELPGTICAYHPHTQKRVWPVACANSGEAFYETIRKPSARVLVHEPPLSVTWLHSGSDLFSEVLRIRRSTALPEASLSDEQDEDADIYLLAREARYIATLRVNQARRGVVDCEAFYPSAFLGSHRSCIGSASRLVRDQSFSPCPGDVKFFLQEVWRHQFQMGMRVDLINCHQAMESFYLRLGYRRVAGSQFVHPRLSTPSIVMLLVADPKGTSPIRGAFEATESDHAEINHIYDSLPPLGDNEKPRHKGSEPPDSCESANI